MEIRYILASMTILMLVLAGCGEPEPEGECPPSCDDANPCTTDSCSKDTSYSCRNAPIPGCSADCGMPCTGAAGMYLEMKCDPVTKSCASAPKGGLKIIPSQFTNEVGSAGNKIRALLTLNQPANVKKDLLSIKISAPQIAAGVSDIKITKVELKGIDENKQNLVIAEKAINKYIWSITDDIEEDIKLSFLAGKDNGEFKTLKLTMNYDYVLTRSGVPETKSASVSMGFSGITLKWMNPGITSTCPTSCDDGNAGTEDVCSAATNFFCENNPIAGACGNFVCDLDENKCSCATDCGPCSGDAGNYLSYFCQQNECRTRLKSGVVSQITPVTEDKDVGAIEFRNVYTYNKPFNVNMDKFKIDIELYGKNENIGGVTVTEVKVLESNIELGSADVGGNLNSIGSSVSKEVAISSIATDEVEKSISLKIYVEYQYITTTGTELKKIDFTKPLGKITLINPTIQ